MITAMTVRPSRPGNEARRKILAELRRGELARERPPSIYALAKAIGLTYTPTRVHLSHLSEAGLIYWAPTRGQQNAGPVLTPAGRMAAGL